MVEMDKAALLNLCATARASAEQGELDIATQNEIIAALEQKGLDTAQAQAIFYKILAKQDADMLEMERLLDELDRPPSMSAI